MVRVEFRSKGKEVHTTANKASYGQQNVNPFNFLWRRNMKRSLYILMSLVVLASMALAACAGAGAPPAPEFSGTVTITFVQEPDNLNPMYTDMYFSSILR